MTLRKRQHGRAHARGFTLVELMVALSGGLLISVFVFMMASQGSKFYQQEARISNATIGVMTGFQRLRADIARAGFLASPNVVRDPLLCSGRTAGEGWTAASQSLNEMAGVRIIEGGSRDADEVSSELAAFWDSNGTSGTDGLRPDQLILAGAFSSTDQFPAAEIGEVTGQPNVWRVHLQANSPAMARLGYRTDGVQSEAERLELVRAAFMPDGVAGRVLRILDRKGAHHYGVIGAVGMANLATGEQAPYIELTNQIVLRQESRTTACGLQGLNVGATVNVVNFIRYGLQRLDNAQLYPEFAALYSDEVEGTHEDTRAELVREELDVAGAPIAGTTELVAEYAVDLKFTLSALTNTGTLDEISDPADIALYAGDPLAAGARPDRIRSVHARLAVRSREADREGKVLDGADVPVGLYRVGLGANGTTPFARVRTLQADIALRNHLRANW